MSAASRVDEGADVNVINFVGKTIVDLDVSATNMVIFTFEDGSRAALEVVAVVPQAGLYGIAEAEPPAVPIQQARARRLAKMAAETSESA